MFFHGDVFSPEVGSNPRLSALLRSVADETGTPIRGSDVLGVAVRQGDEQLLAILMHSVRPGYSPDEVLLSLAQGPVVVQVQSSQPRSRASFSPRVLRALDELAAMLGRMTGPLDRVGVELFLHLTLVHLDEQDQRALSPLDTRYAASLFRQFVEQTLPSQKNPGQSREASPQPPLPYAEVGADAPLIPPQIAPSEDLTRRAREAGDPGPSPFDGDPGYERLFDAIARILHRRQANHVLLVGERGVGKTTVLAELARRAAFGQIRFLHARRFLRVDCRYSPPEEGRQRLSALLARVLHVPELVVCLDGFATLLRGDRPPGNKAVLLSALAYARCQIVGLLTPREFEELVADDQDLQDFFSRVDVHEPELDVAGKLLRHFARGLEQRYRVTIDESAVHQAILLSANYILNDQLPAKALKILNQVCEKIDYERSERAAPRSRVTEEDVIRQVAEVSCVPEETLRGIAEGIDYEQSLREVIFGQDHAVREMATELGLIKAGMTDPNKPASVVLFLGQTGTGKTEMAKALARFYSTSRRLKIYTLGNCVEPHSVSTIIGVPPGYVGNDQGGRLINELNADPYGVFLLDEVDKAHPDVLQPFLNLFDEGWVSDQRGVRAFADKSIFILTSNVGQRMIAEMIKEGKTREEITARMKEALSQIRHTKSERPVFTPEFLARIKRIIVFNSLDQAAMDGICRKAVAEMQQVWLTRRNKRLDIQEELVRHVGEQAYQLNEKSGGKEGGRIVRKLLSEWVESKIQREVTRRPEDYKRCAGLVVRSACAQLAGQGPGKEPLDIRVEFCEQAGGTCP